MILVLFLSFGILFVTAEDPEPAYDSGLMTDPYGTVALHDNSKPFLVFLIQ